jgi:hypothetical protein
MNEEITEERLQRAIIAKENRDNAIKMKEIFLSILKENPDPLGFEHLAELEKMIYTFNVEFVRLISASMRENFLVMIEMLNQDLDKFGDEEFINPNEPAQFLQNFNNLKERDAFYLQIIKQLPAADKPGEMSAEYNCLIEKLELRIDKKRRHAKQIQATNNKETQLQELYKKVFSGHVDVRRRQLESIKDVPLTPLTADGSEYEMPDDYKESLERYAAVEGMCESVRKELAKMSPKKLKTKNSVELKDSLTDMEEWLVSTAKLLEEEKRTFQILRKSVDESEKSIQIYENALQDEIAKNPSLLFISKLDSKPKGQ